MDNKKKKQNQIIKITALLGLFLLVFGISYALFSVVLEGTKKNRITTANFGLILTDKDGVEEKNLPEGTMAINLENAVPMSTQEAIDTVEPYEFIIENTGDIDVDYELYIDVDSNSTLAPSFIKYNLIQTDMTGIPELKSLIDDPSIIDSNGYAEDTNDLKAYAVSRNLTATAIEKEGKTLYRLDLGTIPAKQKYEYQLKIWVNYSADNNAMDKTFEGKLKIYGTQTTKDSVYVVEKADISKYQSEREGIGYLFIKRYSDNSLRFEGFGNIPYIPDGSQDYDYYRVVYNTLYTPKLTEDINKVLTKYGYDEVASYADLWIWIEKCESGEIVISDDTFASISQDLDSIFNNSSNYERTFDLYYGEGICDATRSLVDESLVKRLFVSKTVRDIGGFTDVSNLEEVTFFELENKGWEEYIKEQGLRILSTSFRYCDSLKKVTILDNLTEIGDWTFTNSSNLEVTIKAKKSDVRFNPDKTFTGISSVTWLNG